MNQRERLQEAYENVSFSADKTWTNNPNSYHQSNMELYLTEYHLQRKKLEKNRPRTVRECIPRSRLAQYANYFYNESREMSYASASNTSLIDYTNRLSNPPLEPWELPEVGELYRWFLKNRFEDDKFTKFEEYYQSPLLNVHGFEDKILKIQITEDRVKNIWSRDHHMCERITKTTQLVVNLYTSPMKSVYLFNNEQGYNHQWFRNVSITRDFEQLEQLSKIFQEESKLISKILSGNDATVSNETTSTEILYSEVLQGLSPSRKIVTSSKSEQGRVLPFDDSSTSQDSFTNYTVLNSYSHSNSQRLNQETTPHPSYKAVPQKSSPALYKYPTSSQLQVNSNPRHTRTSLIQPLSTSYVQPTYFCAPVQTVQRWIPPYYPTQIFTSSWLSQNQNSLTNTKEFNRISAPLPLNTNTAKEKYDRVEDADLDQFKEERDADQFVGEHPEHPVSASISEELEKQALEQYSNSNENFYQELERQAAEQYSNSPE